VQNPVSIALKARAKLIGLFLVRAMSGAFAPRGAGGEQRFQLLFALAQRTAGRFGVSEKRANRGR
jgi:hypothetical protein